MAGPIIRTEHLSRFFNTVKAVDDLTLEVPAGIVFGFLGPNGAGKTTTIASTICLPPNGGRVSKNCSPTSISGIAARIRWSSGAGA